MLFLIALVWWALPSLKLPERFVGTAPTGTIAAGTNGYSANGYGFRVEAQGMDTNRGRLGTGFATSVHRFIEQPGLPPGQIYPGTQQLRGFRITEIPAFEGRWTNVTAQLDLWMLEWNWRRRLFAQGFLRGSYFLYGVGSGLWRESLRATYRHTDPRFQSIELDRSEQGNAETGFGGVGIIRPLGGRFWLDGAARYQWIWQPSLFIPIIPDRPTHAFTFSVAVRYTFPAMTAGKLAEQ